MDKVRSWIVGDLLRGAHERQQFMQAPRPALMRNECTDCNHEARCGFVECVGTAAVSVRSQRLDHQLFQFG